MSNWGIRRAAHEPSVVKTNVTLSTHERTSPRHRRIDSTLLTAAQFPAAGLIVTAALAALVATTGVVATASAAPTVISSTRVEESSPSLVYSGTWREMNADADSGGGAKYLNSAGSVKLRFTGTDVSWISRTSPTSGKNNVYIDGVKVRTVDRYSATKEFNVPVFTANGLTEGPHTIELVWIGTANAASEGSNLLIDAVEFSTVRDAAPATPTSPTPTPPPVTAPAPTTPPAPQTPTTPPAPVAITTAPVASIAAVGDRGVSISWVKPAASSPAGYLLKRHSDSAPAVTIATVGASTTSYLDISVVPGIRYRYTVAAVTSQGTITGTSAAVAATAKAVGSGTGKRFANCPTGTITVRNATELKSAFYWAAPGTVIRLAPGTYDGQFNLRRSGTQASPIWVCGSREAILTTRSVSSGLALTVENQHDIVFAGFSIRNSFKGLTVVNSDRITATDLEIQHIGFEAVHLRAQTADSEVTFNRIFDIGVIRPEFGEGIYIGTSDANWCKYNGCQPDRTTRVLVYGNTIWDTGAQAIEAKAGTSNGVIAGNRIDGSSTQNSPWITVKGNEWLISDNIGRNSTSHGYATNASVAGWGKANVFTRNTGSGVIGFGTWIHQPSTVASLGNRVSCLESVAARSGVTNVSCLR